MSSRGFPPAPPAKAVLVCRNGDPFCPPRRFLVSQRRVRTLEALLAEVTVGTGAAVAVRSLRTPRCGRRVAGLGELQDGALYVAVGSEKFKKLNYFSHGKKELRGTRKTEGLQLPPWQAMVLGPWQTPAHTIHVFRNGDLLSPPFPVPVSQERPPWAVLLATLSAKAALPGGAVHRLCRLDGTPVSSGEELVNGRYYVAVGNEEYKKLPYLELLVPQGAAHRTQGNHPNSRRRNNRQGVDAHRVQATGAAKKDKIPTAFSHLQRQGRRSHLGEEGSIFQPQPARAGQNRRNVQQWPEQEASVPSPRDPRKELPAARAAEDEHPGPEAATDQV